MTNLTDTQLVLLNACAQQPEGIPTADLKRKVHAPVAQRSIDSLASREMLRAVTVAVEGQVGGVEGYVLTAAGYEALGLDPPADEADTAPEAAENDDGEATKDVGQRKPRSGTKQEALVKMLKRPNGASVPEVVAATGWQPHTVRGAIAGALKKKLGLTVTTEKVEGRGTVYRIPT